MSKRFIFPQQQGERKKAKLDVTISDHNFPLSQNPGQEADQDNWGDDNDDEILLLASQACEQAYNNDISSLPDYSLCMQPQSTSTQIYDPGPSTSRTGFTFKKPCTSVTTTISTNLKNKCSMISLPLPGMSGNVMTKVQPVNISDDLIFNDKVYKGQDSNQLYRQLLQMQEENAKLKSENGKLLEKCVTKEGEASILRTQLKTCQVAVDNARLEKIKAQEKVQMEWTDKVSAANTQLRDLRNQLDFKNLKIISIKEKCKKLESSKIRLTQVTVGNNDISLRNNNSIIQNDSISHQRRVMTATNATQTTVEKQLFLKLNKSCVVDRSDLTAILPLVLEPTAQHHNVLEYNEKLQRHTDSQNKCRVYSTFHRLPSTPNAGKDLGGNKVSLTTVYEDLTKIAAGKQFEELVDKYCNVFKAVKSVLQEVESELEVVSQRSSTAFQKEMDEKYIDATSGYLHVDKKELLMGRSLYKEEQALLARRIVAVAAFLLQNSRCKDLFMGIECTDSIENKKKFQFLELLQRICSLLDSTSCATLYSGLLLSTTYLIQDIHNESIEELKITITKYIISSRAMPFVACEVLNILRKVNEEFLKKLCPGGGTGNLKLDYDQGVLLFKKDSCYFQVLLRQMEASLKCMERQNIAAAATRATGNLIGIYSNINVEYTEMNVEQRQSKCDCQLVLIQVIVYALRICSVMLENREITSETKARLLAVCRSGIQVLYRCVTRDLEFGSQLGPYEGHLIHFCEAMKGHPHSELYANMLTEISTTFQPSPEDMPTSYHRQAWINSFQNFCIAD